MYIFLIILTFFQTPSYKIRFQFSNPQKQPTSARVKLYSKGQLIKEYQTDGAFAAFLPKGNYKIQVMRCDTSCVNFIADREKMVWVVVDDNCLQ